MQAIQYLKHSDYYGFKKDLSYYFYLIEHIFNKYNSQTILNLLSHLAQEIHFENTVQNLSRIQNQIARPIGNHIWLHRRALSVLFQIFCSKIPDGDKENLYNIQKLHILDLFLAANEILERSEEKFSKQIEDSVKSVLFVSFKWIGDLITTIEIQGSIFFFNEYYNKLEKSENFKEYSSIFENETGIDFPDYRQLLERMIQRNISKTDFETMSKLMSINLNVLNEKWDSRLPKIEIPFEYKFLETFPIIKSDDKLYVCGIHLLFIGFLRKAYHCLSSVNSGKKFREYFGREIVEPTIKEFLNQTFISKSIQELNTSFMDYEYADYALFKEDIIILFEIKSSLMGLNLRYGSDPKSFFKEFDKRYASEESSSGQQAKKILEINKNFRKFCDNTGLNKNKRVTIYSVLLIFDDTLSAEGSNQYIRNKYAYYLTLSGEKVTNLNTPPKNSILTFNELYSLNKELKTPEERFRLLLEYNDFDRSFNFFMTRKGIIK